MSALLNKLLGRASIGGAVGKSVCLTVVPGLVKQESGPPIAVVSLQLLGRTLSYPAEQARELADSIRAASQTADDAASTPEKAHAFFLEALKES